MEAHVTVRVEVFDEIGRHLTTVRRTARKDTGGNPRFLLPKLGPVAQELLDQTMMLAATGIDKARMGKLTDGDK